MKNPLFKFFFSGILTTFMLLFNACSALNPNPKSEAKRA